jgi:hypothetical protein
MEKDICNWFLDNCNLASRGALRFKVRPFFDHSAWNLVIGDSKTVYLLDFPKALTTSPTPQLDLGRLKFSLEPIKQYPLRVPGMPGRSPLYTADSLRPTAQRWVLTSKKKTTGS